MDFSWYSALLTLFSYFFVFWLGVAVGVLQRKQRQRRLEELLKENPYWPVKPDVVVLRRDGADDGADGKEER